VNRVLRYNEYDKSIDQAWELIENICNPIIKESNIDDSSIHSIGKKLSRDLKFNFGLITSFGTGINAMYPIVDSLIRNGNLKVELTPETVILVCITALSITYLEEVKNRSGEEKIVCHDCDGTGSIDDEGDTDCKTCVGKGYIESEVTKKDAQTMLEELKMRGIGNGIIRKFVSVFQSMGNFLKILFRGTPYVVTGLIDMFSYTALLIPTMNAIYALIGKYDLNLDTIIANLLSIGVGLGTIVAKQGVTWLINKLRKSLHLKGIGKDIDVPTVVRPYDIIDDGENDLDQSKLIKEQ